MYIKNYIKKIIKNIWLNKIAKDYNNGSLLLEDSLKCSFYYHLRSELTDSWLEEHRLRIFTELSLAKMKKKQRADIAIAKISEWSDKHLSECVEELIAVIEIKYQSGQIEAFLKDIEKLDGYGKKYPNAMLYGAFIHEENYINPKEFYGLLKSNNKHLANMTMLLGCWGEDEETDNLQVTVYE